jgi:hypothetical protein
VRAQVDRDLTTVDQLLGLIKNLGRHMFQMDLVGPARVFSAGGK